MSEQEQNSNTNSEFVDPTPSNLGTREYWDNIYKTEVNNFQQFGDKGEIWFGEDVQDRVLMHIEEEFEGILDADTSRVLDLGCGNGMFLVQLAQEYHYQNLVGIDYSEPSIDLAKKIAVAEGLDHIEYSAIDFLDDAAFEQSGLSNEDKKFNLIHDKGTFDAICLYTEKEKREVYKQRVQSMLKTGEPAFFIITSCNWTQDELMTHFTPYFDLYSTVQYPSFEFAGAKGSTVATCVFKHKNTDF